MSWFAAGRTSLGLAIEQIVRPILAPFRWARIGMIDFSPILALFALSILQDFLFQLLARYAG